MSECQHTPCATCPWRKSSTVGGADIPGFDLDKMRNLRNTVGEGDAFRPIMACHYSTDGKDFACRGYVAQEGYSNLWVRFLAARGKIAIKDIIDACEGIEMFESFNEMLEAYEAAQ